MEIWKNYNDRLEISNLGNVRLDGIAKPYNGNPKQYRYVGVGNRRSKTVHTIVYQLFGNMPYRKDLVINHKDGNKLNNAIDNLEQVTQRENIRHAMDNILYPVGEERYNAKLTNDQVTQIKELLKSKMPQKDIAKQFNISRPTVCNIKKGKCYRRLRANDLQPVCEGIPGEVWKEYDNAISVSSKGRVKRNGRIIHFYAKNYYAVSINRYPIRVHSLVWEMFGGYEKVNQSDEISHIDGDIHNNNINNLELKPLFDNIRNAIKNGSRKAGENHSSAKLSDDDILLIRVIGKNVSQRKIAEMFGVVQQTIGRILRYESRA